MNRRPLVIAGLALATVGLAMPAYAAWASTGTGTGKATATQLGAATAGSAGNATATSLDLSWTSPTNPAPNSFAITRDGSPITCDFAAANLGTAKCRDTFTASSTVRSFSYVVRPKLGAWLGGNSTFTASPVTAMALAVNLIPSSSFKSNGTTWDATVTFAATSGGTAVNGVVVAYTWSGSAGSSTCTTAGNGQQNTGQCSATWSGIPNATTSVTLTVTSTTKSGATYVTTYSPSNPVTVTR